MRPYPSYRQQECRRQVNIHDEQAKHGDMSPHRSRGGWGQVDWSLGQSALPHLEADPASSLRNMKASSAVKTPQNLHDYPNAPKGRGQPRTSHQGRCAHNQRRGQRRRELRDFLDTFLISKALRPSAGDCSRTVTRKLGRPTVAYASGLGQTRAFTCL